MRKSIATISLAIAALGLAACSEQTQEDAAETLDRAAADTEDNLEVIENTVREGSIEAAEQVSEGAQNLQAELEQDERTDPDQGDGALDGTD